eukprot:9502409-Pyramimonas_sp.AAC.1
MALARLVTACTAAAVWMLTTGLYNPQSWQSWRGALAREALQNFDVVARPGTQQRQRDAIPVTATSTMRHVVLDGSWRSGRLTDKSCGITIMIGRSVSNHVRQVLSSPPKIGITERAGGLKLTMTRTPMLGGGVYLTPYGTQEERTGAMQRISDWINDEEAEAGNKDLE